MSDHFIIGKACQEYQETLDKLSRTSLKRPSLNEDAFTNWIVNKHPESCVRTKYNNTILELKDG